jgi:hypothetical protein
MVRSNVVFFLICCKCAVGRFVVHRYLERFGGGGVTTGHTVEFGVSRISSVRVQDMQQLGYFGNGVGRVPGVEEIPKPEGELVLFEAFFMVSLRLPAHHFVAELLQRFEV